MKTEELQRKPHGQSPSEVSRALQPLLPASWALVDRHGRNVPLTSAGYLLRFNHAYRLRLVSPFKSEEIENVRINNPATFLTVEPTLHEEDQQGRSIHVLPFKVKLDMWAILRRLGMLVSGDELEVVHYFKPGIYREAPPFLCPIVVRPRWATVLVAVLGGLLFMLVDRLVGGLFATADSGRDLDTLLRTAAQGTTWGYFLGLAAAVWLIVNLVNVLLLYRRSRELRQNFRELYPAG